jgi:hypothetical protein
VLTRVQYYFDSLQTHSFNNAYLSSSTPNSLSYDYVFTRFIIDSSSLRLRLEKKISLLRFQLQLLDFLDLPRVNYFFYIYVREGIGEVRLLKLQNEEVTFYCRTVWKYCAGLTAKFYK